jgi:hypothetical protein
MGLKSVAIAGAAMIALMSTAAHATTWTQWSSDSAGVMGAVNVTYAGDTFGLATNYPSWDPTATFDGAGNPPPQGGGEIQLTGGNQDVNTITFSSAVLNPVMAIWSLGQNNDPTRFVFGTSNISLLSGGPSAEYGGQAITLAGNTVTGVEGNGVIRFNGLVSSISWTNPDYEFWYGFTVGAGGAPEPATWAMMLVGFGGLGATLRRRRAVAAA